MFLCIYLPRKVKELRAIKQQIAAIKITTNRKLNNLSSLLWKYWNQQGLRDRNNILFWTLKVMVRLKGTVSRERSDYCIVYTRSNTHIPVLYTFTSYFKHNLFIPRYDLSLNISRETIPLKWFYNRYFIYCQVFF